MYSFEGRKNWFGRKANPICHIHVLIDCSRVLLANFTLPEESGDGGMFKEIIFTDLQREEAAKLVAEYNKVRTYF